MSFFRFCNHSVRLSSVLGFQSGSATPLRFASLPILKISDGPKNLMGLGFVQKSPNPLRHYSVPRILDYVFWPGLSCVTFFTGRFETVPFTNQRLYFLPWLEKVWEPIYFRIVKKLNKNGLLYPQTHPLCVRVESIGIRILEALQRESGRRHKLADRQWLLKYDGTLKIVKKRRQENVKSTSGHFKDGIDWEFFVGDTLASVVCYTSVGKILLCRGSFDVYETDDELAITIATEVGHIVARHLQREITWDPCILYHRLIYGNDPKERYQLSQEHEADYIGMLLSASAGYDPRVAPVALRKMDSGHLRFHLMEERMKYMTQPEVMQKAVDIYEEQRKARGIN